MTNWKIRARLFGSGAILALGVGCGAGGAAPGGGGAPSGGSTTTGGSANVAGAAMPGGSASEGGSATPGGTGGTSGGEATTGGAMPGGGGNGGAGGGGSAMLEAPTQQTYLKALYGLVDLLLSTQINDAQDPNYGALVSPSTNPENHPLHSRAAEAVYPLAVAYKHTQDAKYAKAAIKLGDWLITVQLQNGSWNEDWPKPTGWDGTSADQLISLANAYAILKSQLSPQQDTAWTGSISRAADWVAANFPKGNINYVPTGAVALLSASRAVPNPKPGWLTKADSLMAQTIAAINNEDLLTGEGNGVDLGYNIAQSIGFIAMYGRMLPSAQHVDMAAKLMKAHQYFMYPGGAMDNSWGTRSFKWNLESGTKTAPGVFFSFALIADKDASFQRGAQLALEYLKTHGQDDKGWIVYGPHAFRHPSSNPPSNYSAFARAQSIATAVEFAPESPNVGQVPADQKHWLKTFSTVKTAVFRTDKIMATLTAYGETGSYPRDSMARGGSVSALWFEGYGSTGFLQVSSQTVYSRIEDLHMPIEQGLLPLTPRIETTSGTYFASVLDEQAKFGGATLDDSGVHATTSGVLRSVAGAASGTTFSWTYDFGADQYTKQVQLSSGNGVRIVEPFVDDTGNQYALVGTDAFTITTAKGSVYELKVVESSGQYTLSAGADRAKYWSPFPGIDCYPVVITPSGGGAFTAKYTIRQSK